MNKCIATVAFSLLLGSLGLAQTSPSVDTKLNLAIENFFGKIKTDSAGMYWEGEQELHPVWDLFFYMTLLKTEAEAAPRVRDDVLTRLVAWQLADGTWSVTNSGPTSFDVTAAVLLSLKHIGLDDANTPWLVAPWRWLNNENRGRKDPKAVNIFYRIFLTLLDVLPRSALPEMSPKFIGVHQGVPMSIADLGIFRTLFVPLVVWNFYVDHHDKVLPLDPARVASGGAKMSSMPLDSKVFNFLNAGPEAFLQKFGGDWNLFSQMVAAQPFHIGGASITDDYWAQEGIGYILQRQQKPSGSWYTLGTSLVNMLALHAADKANIDHSGQLDASVQRGIAGLLSWRTLGLDGGHPFVPASRDSIWDTALALHDMSKVDPSQMQSHQTQIERALAWLISARTQVAGDWATRNPLLQGTFAAWSFYPEATYYPDTDCTAAALDVLTDYQATEPALEAQRNIVLKKGFKWLLALQNTEAPNADGGFPAWEKNNSKFSYTIMREMLQGMPRVSDFSQADVSARVLRVLSKAHSSPEYEGLVPAQAINAVCTFLQNTPPPPGQQLSDVWEGDWIADYGYATAEVVSGMLTAERLKKPSEPSCLTLADAAKYLRWFVGIQNPTDGGWGESNRSYDELTYVAGPSTIMHTNFVVRAMLRYEELYAKINGASTGRSPYRAALDRGISFLLSKVGETGDLRERTFSSVYVKGFLYSDYTLMPQYHAIGALAEYAKLIKPE